MRVSLIFESARGLARFTTQARFEGGELLAARCQDAATIYGVGYVWEFFWGMRLELKIFEETALYPYDEIRF